MAEGVGSKFWSRRGGGGGERRIEVLVSWIPRADLLLASLREANTGPISLAQMRRSGKFEITSKGLDKCESCRFGLKKCYWQPDEWENSVSARRLRSRNCCKC